MANDFYLIEKDTLEGLTNYNLHSFIDAIESAGLWDKLVFAIFERAQERESAHELNPMQKEFALWYDFKNVIWGQIGDARGQILAFVHSEEDADKLLELMKNCEGGFDWFGIYNKFEIERVE